MESCPLPPSTPPHKQQAHVFFGLHLQTEVQRSHVFSDWMPRQKGEAVVEVGLCSRGVIKFRLRKTQELSRAGYGRVPGSPPDSLSELLMLALYVSFKLDRHYKCRCLDKQDCVLRDKKFGFTHHQLVSDGISCCRVIFFFFNCCSLRVYVSALDILGTL